MKGKVIAVVGAGIVILALVAGRHNPDTIEATPVPGKTHLAHPSLLYGRVTLATGETWQGRLRWGGDQEAFWGDYFNGAKKTNPWAHWVPPNRLPTEPQSFKVFGLEIAQRDHSIDLSRLFMARFGDIVRIETTGRLVHVTLKSGAAFDLDRFSASDFDDGVRVWDTTRGIADLDSLQIRRIDLRAASGHGTNPDQLQGAVHAPHGDFHGFLQWNRRQSIGADELHGHSADGDLRLRFDTIRSIARRSGDKSLVTLLDGREIMLSGASDVGQGNRGVYVDDARYGRVLVSWDAFESVELSPGGSGPAYGDFPPGGAITGSITTRTGIRFDGRLVYDLDESEVTETLDAPSEGVDYTIPFGLVASIVIPVRGRARVTLHSGEELRLERSGDLGKENAGILIFVDGRQNPDYVRWTDVAQVDLDRPAAMYPPLSISPAPSRSRSRSAPRESVRSQ